MLEATKHLLMLRAGGSLVTTAAWTAALVCWWTVLALFWFNRARFELALYIDGLPTRMKVISIPLLAALIVMASGLGLVSAIMTVSG